MTLKTKTAWRTVRLGDVTSKITKGTTPTTLGRSFTIMGVNFIKAESITDDGRFIPAKFQHIDEETNSMLKRSVVQENDLLYSIAGVIGRPALVTKEVLPANTNQALAIIRPDLAKVDAKFLYYFLASKPQKQYVNNLVAQSAQPNINLEQVSNLEFEAPDLENQKRISQVLSAFDEKIENNNRIIKTLEEMAQAIFKEWFVNFRFPGYEKADLIASPLGRIPKGWEVKKISDVARLNRGVSYASSEISPEGEGVQMINLANFLRGGGFKTEGTKNFTGKFKLSHTVKPGQIVIAMTDITANREIVGHPARIPESLNGVIISLDVCSLEMDDVCVEFLYFLLLRKSFAQVMASSATGTNVSHLSKKSVEEYEFVLPDHITLEKFNDSIRPMVSQQDILSEENKKLAAMRDLILPRLMSGKLSVNKDL